MSEENKKWYKLVFKQNQPIHIGKANWGVINETEIFIPGWTMWGALTNAYLREYGFEDKGEIEKKFEVITNFFPSFDGKTILEPNYRDGEFRLGNFSESEFRLYFVDTTLKTSVEPILRKAKDEHLYEFDYILPVPKREFRKVLEEKGFKDNLYWIGLIRIEEKVRKDFLKKGLEILVGGDTRYGLGELELVEPDEEVPESELEKWNLTPRSISSSPNSKEVKLRNYLLFSNSDSVQFEGELTFLSEFDFRCRIPVVKDAGFFISPGSEVKGFNLNVFDLNRGRFILKNSMNQFRESESGI